jgi:hypothetical protein
MVEDFYPIFNLKMNVAALWPYRADCAKQRRRQKGCRRMIRAWGEA